MSLTPEITSQLASSHSMLVHVYGTADHDVTLNLRSQLTNEAAAWLSLMILATNVHVPPTLFVATMHYWNDIGKIEKEPLSLVTARDLSQRLSDASVDARVELLPTYDEVILGVRRTLAGRETSAEVLAYLQELKRRKMSLKYPVSLATKTHLPRIQMLYQRNGLPAGVIAVEDALAHKAEVTGDNTPKQNIGILHSLSEESRFREAEKKIRKIYSIPGGILGVRILAARTRLVSSQLPESTVIRDLDRKQQLK